MKCWRCITIKFGIEDPKVRDTIVIDDAVTVYNGNAVCLKHLSEQLPEPLQWEDEPAKKVASEAEKAPGYLKATKLVTRADRLSSLWKQADSESVVIKLKAEAKRLYSDLDTTWAAFTEDEKNQYRDQLFEAFSPIMRDIFGVEPSPGKPGS